MEWSHSWWRGNLLFQLEEDPLEFEERVPRCTWDLWNLCGLYRERGDIFSQRSYWDDLMVFSEEVWYRISSLIPPGGPSRRSIASWIPD